MKQEYISETSPLTFERVLQEALAKGGLVRFTGTALENAEYQYTGGNQCKNIVYRNVFWAVVEFPQQG